MEGGEESLDPQKDSSVWGAFLPMQAGPISGRLSKRRQREACSSEHVKKPSEGSKKANSQSDPDGRSDHRSRVSDSGQDSSRP